MVCNREDSGGDVVNGTVTELDTAGENARVGETCLVGTWGDDSNLVTKVDAAAVTSNEEAARVKDDVVEISKEEAESETEGVEIFNVEETAGVTDAVLKISNEEAVGSIKALEETEMADMYEVAELATVELIPKTFVVKLDVVVALTVTDRTLGALVVTVRGRRADEVKFDDFDGRTWTEKVFAMRVKFTVTWGVGEGMGWINLVV